MNDQVRIFEAIGGVDPCLVARSERRRSRRPERCLAAAACLALMLILSYALPLRTEPGQDIVPPPELPGSAGAEMPLPSQGGKTGTIRLLSCTPQSEEGAANFLIYVNGEQYGIYEDNGLYSIRSTNPLPDGFPPCGLDIFHFSAASPADARAAAAAALTEHYAEVFPEEETAVLPGSLYLRAGNGTDWAAEQIELWFVDDRQGGAFILSSRYFTEAEEGMGMRFRDMASSFRAVSLNESVPDWMRSLYETVERLFPALFANDLSGVSNLLAENAEPEAYGENVWANLTIASVDYAPDDDRDPTSAVVSVKHRLNLEEGESFNYLTMELLRQDGRWQLLWAGIEK